MKRSTKDFSFIRYRDYSENFWNEINPKSRAWQPYCAAVAPKQNRQSTQISYFARHMHQILDYTHMKSRNDMTCVQLSVCSCCPPAWNCVDLASFQTPVVRKAHSNITTMKTLMTQPEHALAWPGGLGSRGGKAGCGTKRAAPDELENTWGSCDHWCMAKLEGNGNQMKAMKEEQCRTTAGLLVMGMVSPLSIKIVPSFIKGWTLIHDVNVTKWLKTLFRWSCKGRPPTVESTPDLIWT